MALPLEKVIVCLDYSSKDPELIENACRLCEIAETTEMIFLNIIKDFNLPEQMKKEFPDLLGKAMDERKKELEDLVNEHFTLDLKKTLVVKQGSISKEILNVATHVKSDLIIMGKNKESDSVLTTRVARRSPCNLLSVPQNVRLKFDEVLIPVDFSDYSELSLNRIIALTENTDSTIYLHNVISVPSSYRYSGKSYEEFAEIIQGHAQKDLDLLTKKIKVNGQQLTPLFTIEHGENVIDLIWSESKKKKVDLIVMGAKGRTSTSAIFIGSKAERMIRVNETIPLMIIRKKGAMAGILETLKEKLD